MFEIYVETIIDWTTQDELQSCTQKNRFKVANEESYTFCLVDQYEAMVQLLRRVAVSLATWFNSRRVLKLSAAPRPFCPPQCAALSPSVDWHVRFCIAVSALSTLFFSWISSVATLRWQGFISLREHPTFTVLEHLGLEVGSRVRGPDSATCAGLAHGLYSLGAKVTEMAWSLVSLEL